MKKITMALVIVGAFAGTSLSTSLPAAACEAFSFSFNTGDVAFGYSDGYWDNKRQFHKWRSAREAREYRANFGSRYKHNRHTRERNGGWRDQDGDGISNRNDRDRDGDGVPNRRDDAPNNPRRD